MSVGRMKMINDKWTTLPQVPTTLTRPCTNHHLVVCPVRRKVICLDHVFKTSNITEICFRFLIIQDWFQVLPENFKFFYGLLFLQFLSLYV